MSLPYTINFLEGGGEVNGEVGVTKQSNSVSSPHSSIFLRNVVGILDHRLLSCCTELPAERKVGAQCPAKKGSSTLAAQLVSLP
ncbi:hypothetical protein Ddc_05720 [Ditylenchus destructor]|nr:hypothetical protein Ddc_05720 [Ditylenchus destructor]